MYNSRKRAGINYRKSDINLRKSLMGSQACSDIENFILDELGQTNDDQTNQKTSELKAKYMSD
jgi:hypothetical protein